MRNAALLCLALAVAPAGCSTANVSGQAGSFSGNPVGGSAGASIQGGSAAAGVVVTTAVFAALVGILRGTPAWREVPELLEGRAINEVDCTQPVGDWSKNLKCR